MVKAGTVGMERVRRMLHADEIHRAGITGRGVAVAVLDTGLCRHPDYEGRVIGFYDFVNGRRSCYDDATHGSHVSGILGGNGKCSGGRYRGIAPECLLLHLKVLNQRGEGSLEHIMEAIQWILDNQQRYGIRVMNLSAGTAKKETDRSAQQLVDLVERAWDAGIVVVVAAGNMGPEPGSVTVPGNSRKVITVGSSDGFSFNSGKKHVGYSYGSSKLRAGYSGCGPTAGCICKPEVVVPGTGIVSCSTRWERGTCYEKKSGTSMAAPSVAGAIALLLEREPYLTNVEVKMRLKDACVSLDLPKNRQGWGMPDLRKLIL